MPQESSRPENFLFHDQLVKSNDFGIGAGASYALTGSTDVFVSGFKQLSGSNGVLGSMLAVGIGHNFSPAQILRRKRGAPAQALHQP